MVLGNDNLPRIIYYSADNTADQLYYIQCGNEDCSANTKSTILNDGNAYDFGSLAVDTNNNSSILTADVSNNDIDVITSSLGLFNMNFAALSTFGSCSAIPSGNWAKVSSGTAIKYYNNPTPASNDAITSTANDPTDTGQTVSPQTYQESDGFVNPNALSPSVDGEWDFSLYDAGAPANTTYCFKLTNTDGSSINTYTNYPMVTTFSSGGPAIPTTDQLLRGGQWFSGGTKQAYYWAN